ncbi:MAG TPA: WbqC family protein, partial [Bacteroidales bacterium]|nr:WbqC family protein [Bacteroidales bacterium]
MIFSTAYLPPITFFVYASQAKEIRIEACENFIKQTYRNRCYIYSANGKLSLSIPLDHCRQPQLPLKEVKISYATPWNLIHWRAITA